MYLHCDCDSMSSGKYTSRKFLSGLFQRDKSKSNFANFSKLVWFLFCLINVNWFNCKSNWIGDCCKSVEVLVEMEAKLKALCLPTPVIGGLSKLKLISHLSCHFGNCGFRWILHYFPTVRSCVRPCVTGVTSHISHIYKGINAMLIIRDASTPIYSESKSSWLSF